MSSAFPSLSEKGGGEVSLHGRGGVVIKKKKT